MTVNFLSAQKLMKGLTFLKASFHSRIRGCSCNACLAFLQGQAAECAWCKCPGCKQKCGDSKHQKDPWSSAWKGDYLPSQFSILFSMHLVSSHDAPADSKVNLNRNVVFEAFFLSIWSTWEAAISAMSTDAYSTAPSIAAWACAVFVCMLVQGGGSLY